MPVDFPVDYPAAPYHQESPASAPAAWQPREATILRTEKDRPGFLFRESQLPAYPLPDVLLRPDGVRATTAAEWDAVVRPHLLGQFSRYVYGQSPDSLAGIAYEQVSEDPHALGGRATRRQMRVSIPIPGPQKTFTFDFWVFTPNAIHHPVPAFLLLNNRGVAAADPQRNTLSEFWPVETLIDRGYATAELHVSDVQPDKPDGLSRGIIAALPCDAPAGEHWATLAAWAWAASRVLDGMQSISAIDGSRVAVIGHSRGGKVALLAGARDPRFGMVISNCSGCGGAAPARRSFGETIAVINKVFPHWFCENYKSFNDHPERLPIDQHQLLALIAPRPLYVGCADEDLWADPHGEFLALAAASELSALHGEPRLMPQEMPALDQPLIRGHLAYHVRRGGHDLSEWDWQHYLAFADRVWPKR